MQYQLTSDPETVKMTDDGGIVRFIPANNLANVDSRVYQEWLAIEGNTPAPAEGGGE